MRPYLLRTHELPMPKYKDGPIVVTNPDRWEREWNVIYGRKYGPITEAEHAQHVAARLLNEIPDTPPDLFDTDNERKMWGITADYYRGRQWDKP